MKTIDTVAVKDIQVGQNIEFGGQAFQVAHLKQLDYTTYEIGLSRWEGHLLTTHVDMNQKFKIAE